MYQAVIDQARAFTLAGQSTSPVMSASAEPFSGAALDRQFLTLLSSYRGNGGLARADEVAEIFRNRCGPSMALLARWIVQGRVISVQWQSCIWLPLFQFNPLDLSPHAGLGHVLDELRPVHTAPELAQWFASPNEWLSGHMPAQALLDDLPGVLQAARAERFCLRG